MKIGIYGGTFNPPTWGTWRRPGGGGGLGLDKLLLIPAAIPPHKALPSGTPPQEERLAMVEKWADVMGGHVEVSTLELEREGKSYTSDTLRSIRQTYPDAELWLLMGTDMFLTLHLWHEPEVILSLAGVCAFGRTEQDGEAMFAPQRDYLQQHFHAKITTITLPGLVDISSTRLPGAAGKRRGRAVSAAQRLWLHSDAPAVRHKGRPEKSGPEPAAGLFLFHDAGQAHPPRHGRGGGGGEAGPALGRRPELARRAASSTTAPSITNCPSSWRSAQNTGWSWTSWSRRP